MRSLKGTVGAVVLLATVVLAALVEITFGNGAETVIHFGLAAGFAIISLAVVDFGNAPWLSWFGFAAAAGLAAVFFLQGLSDVVQDESLSYFALQVLGQWLETVLLDAVIVWCAITVMLRSTGGARKFGLAVTAMIACLEAYRLGSAYFGEPISGIWKIPYLLPFVWLLWESAKHLPRIGPSEEKAAQPVTGAMAQHR